jgi:SAM-dependent methyltransferase
LIRRDRQPHPGTGGGLTRQYAKLCDRRDFDDPEIRATIRDIVPGRDPETDLHRKHWEYAMLALFLRDVGALREDAAILSVGAGREEPLYWLANRVGHVVATDIYGEGAFYAGEAESSMLDDPSSFAPYPYRRDRLEARWMDARELAFPDASFDAVFSLSSIEHFGGPSDVAQAAAEIGRVLRPGGHAFIATECFVARNALDSTLSLTVLRALMFARRCLTSTGRRRLTEVFRPRELQTWIVRPSGLRLVQPLALSVSPETFYNVTRVGGSKLHPATGSQYPHIVLRSYRVHWTSVVLALQKSIS